jgi:hypothetical protein
VTIAGRNHLILKGDGRITLETDGNLDINVGGSMHVHVKGDYVTSVEGSVEMHTEGSMVNDVVKDVSQTIGGDNRITVAEYLLDHGADPNTANNCRSILGVVASLGYQEMCTLLISRGANLMAALGDVVLHGVFADCLFLLSRGANPTTVLQASSHPYNFLMQGKTAVELYGRCTHLIPEILDESRAALVSAWQTQIWTPRWPFMSFVTGCRFRPLAYRLAQGIPEDPENWNLELRQLVHHRRLVFSSDSLLRLIVSFL